VEKINMVRKTTLEAVHRRFAGAAIAVLFLLGNPTGSAYGAEQLPVIALPAAPLGRFADIPPRKTYSGKPGFVDSAGALEQAVNYREVMQFLGVRLSSPQKEFLNEHKFLLIPKKATKFKGETKFSGCGSPDSWDEMLGIFDALCGKLPDVDRKPENARLVNPDVVLHAFHKFFSNSLEHLEKTKIAHMLRSLLQAAQARAVACKQATNGELARHFEHVAAQLTVPLILVQNADWQPPKQNDMDRGEQNKDDEADTLANAKRLARAYRYDFSPTTLGKIEDELGLIYEANRVGKSPLFGQYHNQEVVLDDYTQYSVRGHYEMHSILRGYFRAMMFLGRNSYPIESDDGVTDAMLMAYVLAGPDGKGQPLVEHWLQIMKLTGFYAGQSDDICYPEWRDFLIRTLGSDRLDPKWAIDASTIARIKANAKTLRRPRILSELSGDVRTAQQDKDERLQKSTGFRLFGQRFTVDGLIFDSLTAGLEKTDVRLPSTPSSVFVPAVLGDRSARGYSAEFLEQDTPKFSPAEVSAFLNRLDQVSTSVKGMNESDWFVSLGSGWLQVLSRLTGTYGRGYPLFMQSKLFHLKQLESFLGSFTELKHDTILYAKQRMAEYGEPWPEETPPPVPRGLVEPNLDFWHELQRLVEYAYAGFKKYGLFELQREEYGTLTQFKDQVNFYTACAEKHLQGIELTEEEYEKLRTYRLQYMAEPLEPGLIPGNKDTLRSGLIADIHTDAVTNRILYNATGEPYIMLVLIGNDGITRLTIGLAFNYYEFTNPIGRRLTDQEWQTKVYRQQSVPAKSFWFKDLEVK